MSKRVIEWMSIDVERVNWFSTYRVHHRVADHFRKGCAFLLGDAAHIHSPVGGQGMNTGIGDAVNLAWKLAAVLDGRAPASLLDSYEPERIAFARRLVATTDQAFTGVTSDGAIARRVRLNLVPLLMPPLFSLAMVRRFMFRTVSQTSVNYRGSSLSEGRAGKVEGGDRLPWVKADPSGGTKDNFAPLRSLDWQVHVYGDVRAELEAVCEERKLPLHVFPWHRGNGVRAACDRTPSIWCGPTVTWPWRILRAMPQRSGPISIGVNLPCQAARHIPRRPPTRQKDFHPRYGHKSREPGRPASAGRPRAGRDDGTSGST